MNIKAYLKRIGVSKAGKLNCSFDTLSLIHFAHVCAIPFENLDIHLGKKISIDTGDIYKKIVEKNRGGYCYEMNGLLYSILKEMGFEVNFLLARMMYGFNTIKHRSHQIILVKINGKSFIADAGYRNGLSFPIELKAGRIFRQLNEEFFLKKDKTFGYILKKKVSNNWVDIYSFTLEGYLPIDFTALNFYNSTSPDSAFTQRIVCSIKTKKRSYRIIDRRFLKTENHETEETNISGSLHLKKLLKNYFGLSVPKKDCEILFNKVI